jgi:hypothetical protein
LSLREAAQGKALGRRSNRLAFNSKATRLLRCKTLREFPLAMT